MENEQKIQRTGYKISLRQKMEFSNDGKMTNTGSQYLYLENKGKASFSTTSIPLFQQLMKSILAQKIKPENHIPVAIESDFKVEFYRRFKFDKKTGNRVRTGKSYLKIYNPSNRTVIIDEDDFEQFLTDLKTLKL